MIFTFLPHITLPWNDEESNCDVGFGVAFFSADETVEPHFDQPTAADETGMETAVEAILKPGARPYLLLL